MSVWHFLRRHGPRAFARRTWDRLWSSLAQCYAARVFVLSADTLSNADAPAGIAFRWLSADDLARRLDPEFEIDRNSVSEARDGFGRCLAAFEGTHLTGYAWFRAADIPARHCLGAAIELPSGFAYHYKGFTHPRFRGRGVYPALIRRGLFELRGEGIESLVIVVERSNVASLQSCRRAGGVDVGELRIWGPNGAWGITPPAGAARLGLRFVAEGEREARPFLTNRG